MLKPVAVAGAANISSGRALAVGVLGLLELVAKPGMPKGSAEAVDALLWAALLLPRVWGLGGAAPNGSLLREPKGSELDEAGAGPEAGAVPKGSWDAAVEPNEDSNGSLLPNASGAAAGVSLDVEKVDHTSPPGDAACRHSCLRMVPCWNDSILELISLHITLHYHYITIEWLPMPQ